MPRWQPRGGRLPDEELEVDVTQDGDGGVIVTVTHLLTQLSASESGPTRKETERKAQDRLAGIVAEMLRAAEKA